MVETKEFIVSTFLINVELFIKKLFETKVCDFKIWTFIETFINVQKSKIQNYLFSITEKKIRNLEFSNDSVKW
jgi:hypothetical protein